MYDVIIIGSGPAGMSAGLYAKRSGLNTLILEGMYPGGLLNNVSIVDNYIGIKGISGSDLASLMYEHINSIDVKINFEKVLNIEYGDIIKVTTSKNIYETKGIIIAI